MCCLCPSQVRTFLLTSREPLGDDTGVSMCSRVATTSGLGFRSGTRSRPTAALPVGNPYCSCKLTRVRRLAVHGNDGRPALRRGDGDHSVATGPHGRWLLLALVVPLLLVPVLLVVRVLLPFTDLPHCLWHPQPLIFEIDPLLTDAECDHIITKAVSGQQLWFSRCHGCWVFSAFRSHHHKGRECAAALLPLPLATSATVLLFCLCLWLRSPRCHVCWFSLPFGR